jgi:hypothetical protein
VTLHHADTGLEAATALLRGAYVIGDDDVRPAPLFQARIAS